jgi:hypothetical protein
VGTLTVKSVECAVPKTQKESSKSLAFLKKWLLVRCDTETNCGTIFFEENGSVDIFSICCSSTFYMVFLFVFEKKENKNKKNWFKVLGCVVDGAL